MSCFYIGYQPRAPKSVAIMIRRTLACLLLLVVGLALGLVEAQAPFAAANFEFGEVKKYRGIVEEHPVPLLRVALPGGGRSRYPLVAPGKHGAAHLLLGLQGKQVEFDGMLIYRRGITLVEVLPGTLRVMGESAPADPIPVEDLGRHVLTGEIVDTKCYAGVMNPGHGKVHRDCAARCISGGIPPALLSDGRLYYLVAANGPVAAPRLLQFVARPVTVTGQVFRRGETHYIDVGPAGIACAREKLRS